MYSYGEEGHPHNPASAAVVKLPQVAGKHLAELSSHASSVADGAVGIVVRGLERRGGEPRSSPSAAPPSTPACPLQRGVRGHPEEEEEQRRVPNLSPLELAMMVPPMLPPCHSSPPRAASATASASADGSDLANNQTKPGITPADHMDPAPSHPFHAGPGSQAQVNSAPQVLAPHPRHQLEQELPAPNPLAALSPVQTEAQPFGMVRVGDEAPPPASTVIQSREHSEPQSCGWTDTPAEDHAGNKDPHSSGAGPYVPHSSGLHRLGPLPLPLVSEHSDYNDASPLPPSPQGFCGAFTLDDVLDLFSQVTGAATAQDFGVGGSGNHGDHVSAVPEGEAGLCAAQNHSGAPMGSQALEASHHQEAHWGPAQGTTSLAPPMWQGTHCGSVHRRSPTVAELQSGSATPAAPRGLHADTGRAQGHPSSLAEMQSSRASSSASEALGHGAPTVVGPGPGASMASVAAGGLESRAVHDSSVPQGSQDSRVRTREAWSEQQQQQQQGGEAEHVGNQVGLHSLSQGGPAGNLCQAFPEPGTAYCPEILPSCSGLEAERFKRRRTRHRSSSNDGDAADANALPEASTVETARGVGPEARGAASGGAGTQGMDIVGAAIAFLSTALSGSSARPSAVQGRLASLPTPGLGGQRMAAMAPSSHAPSEPLEKLKEAGSAAQACAPGVACLPRMRGTAPEAGYAGLAPVAPASVTNDHVMHNPRQQHMALGTPESTHSHTQPKEVGVRARVVQESRPQEHGQWSTSSAPCPSSHAGYSRMSCQAGLPGGRPGMAGRCGTGPAGGRGELDSAGAQGVLQGLGTLQQHQAAATSAATGSMGAVSGRSGAGTVAEMEGIAALLQIVMQALRQAQTDRGATKNLENAMLAAAVLSQNLATSASSMLPAHLRQALLQSEPGRGQSQPKAWEARTPGASQGPELPGSMGQPPLQGGAVLQTIQHSAALAPEGRQVVHGHGAQCEPHVITQRADGQYPHCSLGALAANGTALTARAPARNCEGGASARGPASGVPPPENVVQRQSEAHLVSDVSWSEGQPKVCELQPSLLERQQGEPLQPPKLWRPQHADGVGASSWDRSRPGGLEQDQQQLEQRPQQHHVSGRQYQLHHQSRQASRLQGPGRPHGQPQQHQRHRQELHGQQHQLRHQQKGIPGGPATGGGAPSPYPRSASTPAARLRYAGEGASGEARPGAVPAVAASCSTPTTEVEQASGEQDSAAQEELLAAPCASAPAAAPARMDRADGPLAGGSRGSLGQCPPDSALALEQAASDSSATQGCARDVDPGAIVGSASGLDRMDSESSGVQGGESTSGARLSGLGKAEEEEGREVKVEMWNPGDRKLGPDWGLDELDDVKGDLAQGEEDAAGLGFGTQQPPDSEAPEGEVKGGGGGRVGQEGVGEGGSFLLVELEPEQILAEFFLFCQVCGRGFKREANLKIHMRGHGDRTRRGGGAEHHSPGAAPPLVPRKSERKGMRFSCPSPGCPRHKAHPQFQPLKTLVCLKNHFKRSHGPRTFECSKCGAKSFAVQADLKTHEKHCGSASQWVCSCGNTFSRRDKLNKHLELFRGHSAVSPRAGSGNV